MTAWEYEALQALLSLKAKKNPYTLTGNNKRAEGYKDGILAAKSILHSFYQHQTKEKA